jgi:RNA polymerase sigma-70 factor (ECF subfamily)
VTAQRPDEEVVQAWHAHRSYLIDLAFRMLGDIGAAEDVVQDAFCRLLRTTPSEIDDARGWLIVVTSRLCRARDRRSAPARLPVFPAPKKGIRT